MTYFATSNDGTRIAFDRYGSGPAVVLVGGMTHHRALDLNTSNMAAQLAQQGFTVIDYDRRGRGESGDQAPYSIAREVEDLAALITDVGGEAFVFGNSSGAVLALFAAATEGVGVKKLALFEPPLSADGGDGGALLRGLQERIDANDRDATLSFFLKSLPPDMLAAEKLRPSWPLMLAVAHTLAYDATILNEAHARPWSEIWATVTQPTLIMFGDPTLDGMEPAADALVATLKNADKRRIVARDHHWKAESMATRLGELFRA